MKNLSVAPNKNLIPISALLTFGIITMSNVQTKGELFNSREIIGFLAVFTMLSAGADLGIPIASGFALLVLVTIALSRGEAALAFVAKKTEKPKRKKDKGKTDSKGVGQNGSLV